MGEKKHVNKGTSSGRPRGEAERNKAIGRDILYLGDRLGSDHGLKNFKDTNPLMSSLLVSFGKGWWSNFVASESGQKQSVKLLQNMVHNTVQHPHPPTPPQPHTVCIYCTFSLGRGERGDVREKVEGQQYSSIVLLSMGATGHTAGSQIPTMSECISSLWNLKYVKHNAAKSSNLSILKKSRQLGFVSL